MKKFSFLILMYLFALSYNAELLAQGCCTAGSSAFGGLERGIAADKTLNLGFGFIRNDLSTTFNEGNKVPDPLNRKASVTSFNFEIEYGLSDIVSVLLTSGFIIKNRETTVRSNENNQTEVISYEGKGVGDVTILGKYEVITPTIISPLGFTIGAGVKLPVGSFSQEINGSRLAIDLQPGSGSTDALLWTNFYKGFQSSGFGLFSNIFYKYAGSNIDGYRFGDELAFSLSGEYYFTEYLTLSLSARGRIAGKDFWGGRFLPSTGGTYYDVLPSLIYSEDFYSLKIFYQAPLHRNVQGIQLTTSSIIGAELLFHFNLSPQTFN